MTSFKFSVWYKLFLISAIIREIQSFTQSSISLFKQYNPSNQTTDLLIPPSDTNITEVESNLDFVIKFGLKLNEDKAVPYLRDEIYENYEKHNITTKDFIDLWKLEDYELRDILNIMGIPKLLLNLKNFRNVLEIANLPFNDYFHELKKNVTNSKLQEAFQILNIDPSNFSSAMAFGNDDEDIYEVLGKGVYNWEKFEEVKNRTECDIPKRSKNLILERLSKRTISSVVNDLQKWPFINKKLYNSIWDGINSTIPDIYKIANMRKVLDDIYDRLAENVTLGVAVDEHKIIIHERILENWKTMLDIIKIYGETLSSHRIYNDMTMEEAILRNTAILRTHNSLRERVDVIDQLDDVTTSMNCTYIDKFSSENAVDLINVTFFNATVGVADGVIFNFGNPIICDGRILGLVVNWDSVEKIFYVDTFFKKADEKNGSFSLYNVNFILILFTLIIQKNTQL